MGKIRLSVGISLINISNLLYKLARHLCACILKPTDLAALTKHCYSLFSYLKGCSLQEYVDAGLDDTEKHFAAKYMKPKSRVLVIGCGGGRETISLAKEGFEVTGIDFVQDCIRIAQENAAKINLHIEFMQQDITALQLPEHKKFDAIMFSALLYSLLPSKKNRIAILKKIKTYAAPGAVILLNFLSDEPIKKGYKEKLKKLMAFVTWNQDYETGDSVEGDGEYNPHFALFYDGKSVFIFS
jgi:2-polyprenyl-3-methyl-5-hydroxy-6-metoxy-1,4-benzoquinol methylase